MLLDDDQVARYERDGFLSAIPVLTPQEVQQCMARLQPFISPIINDPEENQRMQYKAHLMHPWLNDLVRHPKILDVVESLLGPDLMVWNSGFLVKAPRNRSFVSWHQDGTYWGLEPLAIASAWLAFCDSTPDNGCVYCLPGTHRLEQIPHRDTYATDNMLSRGQEVDLKFDEDTAIPLTLRAGEMSIHHARTIHGSPANNSGNYRIGFIINYITPEVRQKSGKDSATLVRGVDRFHHFAPEPRPLADRDESAMEAHAAAVARQKANILDVGQ
jgi:ectoine hydroxylase-related dioxygenase (phytanoyl-CoA dioxygenase family)